MKHELPLLIVDDEQSIRRILQVAFEKTGLKVETCDSAEAALEFLKQNKVCCMVTDVTMPGMSGLELQSVVADHWPDLPVVIMTAFGTIPQAIAAIRKGAFEFVTKPFDLDSLKKIVSSAIQQGGGAKMKSAGSLKGNTGASSRTFIAESPQMKSILATVEQIADTRATVLISGESGTGKEVVARLIHDLSNRSKNTFVGTSCAAIPESLLESELFGYEKGAFTGAMNSKPGRFELAHEGTLFLDEIGDVPPLIQVKLLRVLQEREFERLGATQATQVDVRLITASHRDLELLVDEGTFRLDLLYRLKVIELHLPPLRERLEDIKPLVMHYLAKFSAENERSMLQVESAALAMLESHSWPGNVRELSNVIERAVALAQKDEEVLLTKHLPMAMKQAA